MIDILLVAIPLLEPTDSPPAGIYTLKPWLEQNGYTVKCVNGYRIGHDVDKILEEINKHDFNWLGVSVFSPYEIDMAIQIGLRYKKVIFGGPGCHGIMQDTWKEKNHTGESHFINGEGEYALIELLKGNTDYPGIDGRAPEQILDLDNFPAPDYSELRDHYNVFTITGSRGCVRKCSFCNVPLIWQKYVYTDGEKLAKNMIEIYKKCVKPGESWKFIQLSDSLINGSDKSLAKMCDYLINSDTKVPWTGQVIVKDRPKEYFKKIVQSGARALNLGIESFSHNTRIHMNKKFTDEVMFKNIDYFMEAGLPNLYIQLIVGYPSETEEDFFTIAPFLKKYSKYRNRLHIVPSIMVIDPETPVGRTLENPDFYRFTCEHHDFEERVKRYLILVKLMQRYRYHLDPQTFPQKIAEIKREIGDKKYRKLDKEASRLAKECIRSMEEKVLDKSKY